MRYFSTIFVDFQENACSNQARNSRCDSLMIKTLGFLKDFEGRKILDWEYGELWAGKGIQRMVILELRLCMLTGISVIRKSYVGGEICLYVLLVHCVYRK